MTRHRPVGRAVIGLLALNAVLAAVGLTGHRSEPRTPKAERAAALAVEDGRRFLARHVASDGRVVRHDQGGDTVSEGQAYAMLVSVGLGDRATFDRVWGWTTEHLQRADHLLSWHWENGVIVDAEPAADADLDAAWALALAARRWPDGSYAAAAADLSRAMDAHEVTTVGGRRILVAGPWAIGDVPAGSVVVNPSYASPVADTVLANAGFGPPGAADARRVGNRAVVAELVDPERGPPDWARVRGDGSVEATAGPDVDGPGRFGWDAVRVPLRFAASCEQADRAVAAAVWPAMVAGAGLEPMGDHPARLVGAAGAAAAAGHRERAVALLDEASSSERRHPTYYGSALTALARLLLTTDRLGSCPPLARTAG